MFLSVTTNFITLCYIAGNRSEVGMLGVPSPFTLPLTLARHKPTQPS